jgi:hypothetical protein
MIRITQSGEDTTMDRLHRKFMKHGSAGLLVVAGLILLSNGIRIVSLLSWPAVPTLCRTTIDEIYATAMTGLPPALIAIIGAMILNRLDLWLARPE